MMYQKMIIVGNLGTDPEMRFLQDGTPVTSFSVATNRKWSGGEQVTWFRVSVWGPQAEACNKYLSKGRQVLVDGQLAPDKETGAPRIWQTNDGQSRASYEVRAYTVQFLGGGGDGAAVKTGGPAPKAGGAAGGFENFNQNDIPF